MLALPLLLSTHVNGTESTQVDYAKLADITVTRAWQLAPGEHVVVFWDPAFDRGMEPALVAAVRKAGGIIEDIRAPTLASVKAMSAEDLKLRDARWAVVFKRSQVAIWLPSDLAAVSDQPFEHLVEISKVRSIHFHWFLPPDSNDVASIERMYAAAIDVSPAVLAPRLVALEHRLRGAAVHVTAPNGTDLFFEIPRQARFHRNTGDASASKVANARSVRDREEELPASVLRTTDLNHMRGTWVGNASFDTRSPLIEVTFADGKITSLKSLRGADQIVKEWQNASGSKNLPGEFVVGTNPALKQLLPSGYMPYYGYGAGVVRLAIGDNWESGGNNRSSNGEITLFLAGATVGTTTTTLIKDGNLIVDK